MYTKYCENCEIMTCIVTTKGITMKSNSITTMNDWPIPKSVRDIHVLLSFNNFYHYFIQKYLKIAIPKSKLIK